MPGAYREWNGTVSQQNPQLVDLDDRRAFSVGSDRANPGRTSAAVFFTIAAGAPAVPR